MENGLSATTASRSGAWKWWVCGLLLLATTFNYMDRQTLANVAVRICNEFNLSQEKYGNLEMVFGWAFASEVYQSTCDFVGALCPRAPFVLRYHEPAWTPGTGRVAKERSYAG